MLLIPEIGPSVNVMMVIWKIIVLFISYDALKLCLLCALCSLG